MVMCGWVEFAIDVVPRLVPSPGTPGEGEGEGLSFVMSDE
jgi:hypothetical protein